MSGEEDVGGDSETMAIHGEEEKAFIGRANGGKRSSLGYSDPSSQNQENMPVQKSGEADKKLKKEWTIWDPFEISAICIYTPYTYIYI